MLRATPARPWGWGWWDEPPTGSAFSQNCWHSSAGAGWCFSPDYPIGLTAAPGQERAPGQGESLSPTSVSHARLFPHTSRAA